MKPSIISLEEIKKIVSSLDLMPVIEQGFVAYSSERTVVPPVGELLLEKGEVHIKYGYIKGDEYYVIKIASGFSGNFSLGLSSSNGLMLLFSQQTGELTCILLDEGFLTDTRTAIAGAISAKYLAPEQVERIGIVGTGTQARLQLMYLEPVVACRDVLVWGRGEKQVAEYRGDMVKHGFQIETTTDIASILRTCNLVVTTTPAKSPLLLHSDLRSIIQKSVLQKGLHITAVGSDTAEKQELDASILERADLVVADSISQCLVRGEIHQAIQSGLLSENQLFELGHIINGTATGRISDNQITVADLTGVAVQDIKIAEVVYRNSL
ncbi:MAG: ornithine cyclodeaminase family protein [Rhodothermia bacterium]|nr:MAG: ornithine cyclodeaminase family protein [Rhodothermia bacterium]